VAEKPPAPAKPEPPRAEPPRSVARPAPPKPAEAKPAPEPEADDFAALLRSVEKLDRRHQAPETRAGRGVATRPGTAGRADAEAAAQISASRLAALISRQVTPCWRIPIGAQGVGGMRAEVNILMAPDGNVQAVIPLDEARIAGDPVFRAFAESAVRAVRACSPLKLPPESYAQWRNVIFNFDPSMLAG
jgi:outer membrane biosynthesis protein TonB